VKYEEIDLKDYQSVAALKVYFDVYNPERPHQTHGGATPVQVYTGPGGLALAA